MSHPTSYQLVPPRSLVHSGLLPLLLDGSDDDQEPEQVINRSAVISDDSSVTVKERLPADHPAQSLSVSPADVRKKLSNDQIETILGLQGDFIRWLAARPKGGPTLGFVTSLSSILSCLYKIFSMIECLDKKFSKSKSDGLSRFTNAGKGSDHSKVGAKFIYLG
jgi:hypothetical protein